MPQDKELLQCIPILESNSLQAACIIRGQESVLRLSGFWASMWSRSSLYAPALEQLVCWIDEGSKTELPRLIRGLSLQCSSVVHRASALLFCNIVAGSVAPIILPSLTHLEFVVREVVELEDTRQFTQRLVQDLRRLPLIDPSNLDGRFLVVVVDAEEGFPDGTGVVVPMLTANNLQAWDLLDSKDNNLWTRAERTIAARQATSAFIHDFLTIFHYTAC
ncbi:hypothetical protein FB45DRAFT_1039483 [Roridomyces roridus]|uniref:Uncharacterized protein n=1 Tax=Roridomyces roridus TaxID=1738132 RepID=A0AAD7B2L0_9AGAR|nr:hypothetical protein FB45DRAFT_1039483 [Roridomyces roridus]